MICEYGYEFDAVLGENLWAYTKGKTTTALFKGAICLRSGRDAIKAIAREYAPTVVLLPALSCDSMVLPFSIYHHAVRYYQIDSDYSINVNSVEGIIPPDNSKVLMLYMDYFGNSAIDDAELERLRSNYPNLVFIEDRTHNLLIERKSLFNPEYIVGSLRKWANIPDGGLLWVNKPLSNSDFADDTSFSEMRLKAQCMRNRFLQSGEQQLKNEYRHVFSTVSDIIDKDPKPARMTEYAYQLAVQADWDLIRKVRKENAQALINELKNTPIRFIQSVSGTGDLYLAILIEKRDELQGKLAAIGIFCTVIWPLNDQQKTICKTAKYTQEHMLAIYCDQRYTAEDMKYIASNIKRFINE